MVNCRKLRMFLIVCFAGVVADVPAEATDAKVTAGSACRSKSAGHDADLATSMGGITNVGAAAVYVTCPVVRDITGTTSGLINATLDFSIDASNDYVSCWLYSSDRDGDVQDSVLREFTGAVGDGVLDWDGYINTTVAWGYYHFGCYMSTDAVIYSYIIDEND